MILMISSILSNAMRKPSKKMCIRDRHQTANIVHQVEDTIRKGLEQLIEIEQARDCLLYTSQKVIDRYRHTFFPFLCGSKTSSLVSAFSQIKVAASRKASPRLHPPKISVG